MAKVKREYKDRLFNFIFGNEEHRDWTLNLYNAINGSAYKEPELIRFNTIKDVIYLGMHNDVSFLIADEMTLFEQQSSYNPNMPLRLLQYSGSLFEKYVKEHGYNKYGRRLIPLPVPKLAVFYNGKEDAPDETVLRLKDSFPEGAESDIQVSVRMLNINDGRNQKLLEKCRPLKEYSWLVARIREHRKTMSMENAVDSALHEIPDDFVLKDFLDVHRAEVQEMLLTEYNEAEVMEDFRREGFLEGEKLGEIKGEIKGESRLAELMSRLFAAGRTEDARRAATDAAYRKELFAELEMD